MPIIDSKEGKWREQVILPTKILFYYAEREQQREAGPSHLSRASDGLHSGRVQGLQGQSPGQPTRAVYKIDNRLGADTNVQGQAGFHIMCIDTTSKSYLPFSFLNGINLS